MRRLDAAVAILVAVGVGIQVFVSDSQVGTNVAGGRWLTVPLIAVLSAPLLWRRSKPLLAGCIVLGGIVVQALVTGDTPEGIAFIAIWVLVPYGMAAYARRREARIGLGVTLASFAVYAIQNDDVVSGRAGDVWSGAFFLVLAVGAWLAGTTMRGRREAHDVAQATAAARTDERARMARELHDIVSHNLSVVVLQAAGARAQATGDADTLEKIERSGREALVEMRRLLGVLREDSDPDARLTPQPGLAQLPGLVERIRSTGLDVELDIRGDWAGIEPALDLSAYRIVQEGLTNALKHAGPDAHVRVRVHRDAQHVAIGVSDDGAAGQSNANGGGHGLVGMRERVAMLGGELRVAHLPGGGFEIDASLPVR